MIRLRCETVRCSCGAGRVRSFLRLGCIQKLPFIDLILCATRVLCIGHKGQVLLHIGDSLLVLLDLGGEKRKVEIGRWIGHRIDGDSLQVKADCPGVVFLLVQGVGLNNVFSLLFGYGWRCARLAIVGGFCLEIGNPRVALLDEPLLDIEKSVCETLGLRLLFKQKRNASGETDLVLTDGVLQYVPALVDYRVRVIDVIGIPARSFDNDRVVEKILVEKDDSRTDLDPVVEDADRRGLYEKKGPGAVIKIGALPGEALQCLLETGHVG